VITEVTVTDPHHPLHGQRLELIGAASARGAGWLTVALPDGRRRSLRRAVTDLSVATVSGCALPLISVRTLLPLARHVEVLLKISKEEIFNEQLAQSRFPVAGLGIPSRAPGVAPPAVADAADGNSTAAGSAGGTAASADAARTVRPVDGGDGSC
jgi:hypothetical protein